MSTTTEPDFAPEQSASHPEASTMRPPEGTVPRGEDIARGATEPSTTTGPSMKLERDTLTGDSTFAEVAARVQRKYWAGHTRTVRENYGNILKYLLLPALGEVPIRQLDNEDLEELFSAWQDEEEDDETQVDASPGPKKKGRVKRSTIEGRITVLRSILKFATAKRLMDGDPLSIAVRILLTDQEAYQAKIFSPTEEIALLEAMTRLKLVYRCLFLLVLRTGMRIGEALGLEINDVDLTARTITIRRSWTCGNLGSPKYGSKRTIGISDDLFPILKAYMELIRHEELMNWLEPTVYLFPGASRKKPLCLMSLRQNVWKMLLADAGLPYRRIHDLRHTFATTMLRAKADLHLVSRWLGHKNLGTTFDTYCHLLSQDYLLLTTMIGAPNDPRQDCRPCPICRRPLTKKLRQSVMSAVMIIVLASALVLAGAG